MKKSGNPNYITSQHFSQVLDLFTAFGETVTHPVSVMVRESILLLPVCGRDMTTNHLDLIVPPKCHKIDPIHLIIADTYSPKPSFSRQPNGCLPPGSL